MNFIKKHCYFLLFLLFSITIRLANISDSLFFTWDNGRDFFAVKQIIDGDLTLIGPTTGLPGFFLGPLWFYLGIPGYILSGANPYGFLLSYILIGFTALPLFWIFSHDIFKNKNLARLNAVLLSVIPGSIWGTIRVWNPMIAIPLMMGVFLSLIRARKSRFFLGLAFFLLGLTLQSEFAYAIFYIFVLFLLIPWIRKKFDIRDFLISVFGLGITLIPQVLFEIRHNFIMSNSLFKSIFIAGQEKITWAHHLSQRPAQLFEATKSLFIRGGNEDAWPFYILLSFILIGSYIAFNKKQLKKEKTSHYAWQLIIVLAILPYFFYLIWKGNHGFFFDYYITSHYIFLVPLLTIGMAKIYNLKQINTISLEKYSKYFIVGIIGFFATYWYQSAYATTLNPINNAGLKSMDNAILKIYSWIKEDNQTPGIIRVFTPNAETEHYDAIIHWRAKKLDMPIPITVRRDDDEYWYVLIEPDYQLKKRLIKWYAGIEENGIRIRTDVVGDMRLETWMKKDTQENQ